MQERTTPQRTLKRVATFLFILLISFSSILAIKPGFANPKAETWRIGIDPTYAPFAYVDPDSGSIQGFDIELTEAISREANRPFELVPLPFDGLIPALQTRSIDFAISAMTITLPRSRAVDFSQPYFKAGQGLITSTSPSAPANKNDLKGKTIAVVLGSLGSDVAKKQFKESEITHFSSAPLALKAVADGIVDAAIEGSPAVKYSIDQGGLKGIKILDANLTDDYYGGAFPPYSKELEVFNKALDKTIESGQYRKIYEKWFNESPPALPKTAPVLSGENDALQKLELRKTLTSLSKGLGVTILLTIVTATLGLCGAAILVWLGKLELAPISVSCRLFVELLRGTPILIQLFIVYFGLPGILHHLEIPITIDKWTASIATLSLNAAAYGSEILRGAIDSIDPGQQEAADSLGFAPSQSMRWIIAPQALKIALPGLGNQFITLIKDTSLVAVIGLNELFRDGQLVVASTYRAFEVYILVAIIYLALTSSSSVLFKQLEKRYAPATSR